MPVEPIETIYKGHKFRSRLEARWAVAFDHLNIAWQYEPQGFEVGGDTVPKRRYLPDFHLPYADLWVEVKGDQTRLDWDLMAAAVDPGGGATLPDSRHAYGGFGSNGSAVLILGNIPGSWMTAHVAVHNAKSAKAMSLTLDDVQTLDAVGRGCLTLGLHPHYSPTSEFATVTYGLVLDGTGPWGFCDLTTGRSDWWWYGDPPDIDGKPLFSLLDHLGNVYSEVGYAYQAARQARFEWGETG